MGMALRFVLPASALVIAACAGGGGSFSGDYQDTLDRAPNSLDGVQDTNKRSAVSNESVASTTERPGGGSGSTTATSTSGTAGFNCLGTFKCTVGTNIPGASTSKLPTTKLRLPGVCTYQGSGFNPDGTITKDGQVVGTWEVTQSGFRVTESATASTSTTGRDGGSTTSITVNITLDCTKISDSFTGDDDDDDVAEPPASQLDAGTR
jgi:hypothetical protein